MLTGVAFLSANKLAVSAYDIDQLRVLLLDCPSGSDGQAEEHIESKAVL